MRASLIATTILVGSGLLSCAKKSKDEDKLSEVSTTVAVAADLPVCSAESLSQVFWIESEAKFVVCNGTAFVDVKGEKGEKGEAGKAGSAANSGVWVFDADLKSVALLVDPSRALVLFSNGGVGRINLNTGGYSSAPAISDRGSVIDGTDTNEFIHCLYSDASCSGTCYQMKGSFGTVEKTIKGAIYRGAAGYLIASGIEDPVSGFNPVAKINPISGACEAFGLTGPMDAYPITKIYTFPEDITLPLRTPLSFGVKSGQ